MKMTLRSMMLVAGAAFIFTACDKDDKPGTPSYTVPDTYNFDNVEYEESAARISMWVGFTGNLGKGNVRQLSQDSITNMWNNTNSSFANETVSNIPFTADELNALSFNLSGKTADAVAFKQLADLTVQTSAHFEETASKGVPGILAPAGGGTKRLVNEKGLEYNQAVAKGMMGALSLNNIIAILDKISTDDNTTVVAGQGTAMQHNWDLAFGYVGIPKDYDTSFNYSASPQKADRPLGLGGYFAERGKYIQAGGKVFEAFRKGRAAIGAKDYAVRDEAIAIIKEYIEKTLAAAAYAYVTNPQGQSELASKFHGLSEGAGFVLALKYRPANSKLTAENYNKLAAILNTDFWVLAEDASNTKLKEAQAILTTAYGQLQAQ